jgi:hypothetical protein
LERADLSPDEANILLKKFRNQIENTLQQPLMPFIQVLIQFVENLYQI